MSGISFDMKPKKVPYVSTRFRKIKTRIPVPASLRILRDLRRYEPLSMTGQPLVVWDHAKGCQVFDGWGNKWLDWSSGVLVANSGHSAKPIVDAVVKQAKSKLLHNYCFPSAQRAKLTRKLVEMTPKGMDKVFLLTTGAETTECAIKLMRSHGREVGGDRKIGIVSFERAFHGRTMGAQQIGGSLALKEWIVNLDPCMWQVPFPDGFWHEDTSFDGFLKALEQKKVTPDMVAGVIVESYQGGGASFTPKAYMQALAKWCKQHDVVLACDEVQAGFSRTGKLFAFEHYGIVPDLLCLGKGISSSLPISAVIGRTELLDQYPAGSMTSTHTGNPVCCAAALANIDFMLRKRLWKNAEAMGKVMLAGLKRIQKAHADRVGSIQGKGLVYAMHIVKPGAGKTADYDFAFKVVERCVEKGLLMFSPVGASSIKICPPLVITKAQVEDGLSVLRDAFDEIRAEEA
jgi:4-aminobutyrate aminotransferase/diaminobutyrate-pyruvate transaminase/4-aminobutyrate aminotransferase/(S)-3-amino-2-methylpropionate transaminase